MRPALPVALLALALLPLLLGPVLAQNVPNVPLDWAATATIQIDKSGLSKTFTGAMYTAGTRNRSRSELSPAEGGNELTTITRFDLVRLRLLHLLLLSQLLGRLVHHHDLVLLPWPTPVPPRAPALHFSFTSNRSDGAPRPRRRICSPTGYIFPSRSVQVNMFFWLAESTFLGPTTINGVSCMQYSYGSFCALLPKNTPEPLIPPPVACLTAPNVPFVFQFSTPDLRTSYMFEDFQAGPQRDSLFTVPKNCD